MVKVTRSFHETVQARAARDPAFREALITGTMSEIKTQPPERLSVDDLQNVVAKLPDEMQNADGGRTIGIANSVIAHFLGKDWFQVVNHLPDGAISVGVYKVGKLAAIKTSIAPGQKAAFQFTPTIWIGAVSQVDEGSVMNSAVVSSINTELSLIGIASADIVMTGGGAGPAATPFEFAFENVVYA